jgi:hypothetical protein
VSLPRYAILVLSLAALALVAVAALAPADAPLRAAVGFGVALAALNTLASRALVAWSAGRSTRAFLGAVLGGLAGRMALMLGAVVAAVLGLGLPQLPLVVSLLACFTLFLVMELALQQRQVRRVASR